MAHIDRLVKTPKAWSVLARPDLFDRQAHTLMLMANGRRGVQELSLLLGGDVAALATRLQQQGYLKSCAAPADAAMGEESELER